MSPGDVEEKLLFLENFIVSFLRQKGIILKVTILFSIIFVSKIYAPEILKIEFSFLYFSRLKDIFQMILLISGLSAGMLFFKRAEWKLGWSLFVFALCGIVDFYQREAEFFLFLTHLLMGGVFWSLRPKIKKNTAIWGFIFSTLLLFYLSQYFDYKMRRFFVHQPIFFSAFIVAALLENVQVNLKRRLQLLFNPAHLFLMVNYPIDNYLEKADTGSWESGLVHFFKLIMALMLVSVFYKYLPQDSICWSALKNYLVYLGVVIVVGNTITALSKFYGIDVPVCSNFALLSKSPFEFLKRENAHAYIFSLRFIYFNMLKYTRYPLLIVLGYFLIFPFYRNSWKLISTNNPFLLKDFFISLGPSYFLWLSLFIGIMIFPSKLLKKYVENEWWHVLLNHLVMYVVFLMNSILSWQFLAK